MPQSFKESSLNMFHAVAVPEHEGTVSQTIVKGELELLFSVIMITSEPGRLARSKGFGISNFVEKRYTSRVTSSVFNIFFESYRAICTTKEARDQARKAKQ